MRKRIKIISSIVAVVVAVSCFSMTAFAADLTNSVGSVGDDFNSSVIVGTDNTQGKTGAYENIIDNSNATTDVRAVSADVYATQVSAYSVRVPKVIILNGADGSGEYKIGVKGNISGSQTITVAPVDADADTDGINFVLSEHGTVAAKANILATVTQAKTAFTQNEINATNWTTINANITAPDISAGQWHGTVGFNISIM